MKLDSSDKSTSSSISTLAIEKIIDKLKNERHRNSTKKSYYGTWKKFNEFFIKLDRKPAEWEERIVLFAGYLVNAGRKSGTIKSYISAIKSVLKDDGVEINENKFLLTSLTKACKFTNDSVRTRLPIQKGVLNLLLDECRLLFATQPYLDILYRALFVSAYYGMLRVGEMAEGSHPIFARDVHIATNKKKILFILRTSKTHWTDSRPQKVKICGNENTEQIAENYCPFKTLQDYILFRGPSMSKQDKFFIFRDGQSIKPSQMLNILKLLITQLGFSAKHYATHGFRIGRSQDLLKMGISVETIRQWGRWRSNCVYTYLK